MGARLCRTRDSVSELNTLSQRPAVWALEAVGLSLWGFRPNLMAHFVEQRGGWAALAWFASNMPKYERILKTWGPLRTHLVATVISSINGCPYCTYGHAYAFGLHFLKETVTVSSMDEAAFINMGKQPDDDVLTDLPHALDQAGLTEDIVFLERLMVLRKNPAAVESIDDERLLHLIEMFAALNTCGINGDVSPGQAHDPINRDKAIRERYTALRAA